MKAMIRAASRKMPKTVTADVPSTPINPKGIARTSPDSPALTAISIVIRPLQRCSAVKCFLIYEENCNGAARRKMLPPITCSRVNDRFLMNVSSYRSTSFKIEGGSVGRSGSKSNEPSVTAAPRLMDEPTAMKTSNAIPHHDRLTRGRLRVRIVTFLLAMNSPMSPNVRVERQLPWRRRRAAWVLNQKPHL